MLFVVVMTCFALLSKQNVLENTGVSSYTLSGRFHIITTHFHNKINTCIVFFSSVILSFTCLCSTGYFVEDIHHLRIRIPVGYNFETDLSFKYDITNWNQCHHHLVLVNFDCETPKGLVVYVLNFWALLIIFTPHIFLFLCNNSHRFCSWDSLLPCIAVYFGLEIICVVFLHVHLCFQVPEKRQI